MTIRINGGRFYQQTRRVKGKTYGPYWYCRSGWGRVTHLGATLPACVETAQIAQHSAQTLLRNLDNIRSLLNRFTRGDVLNSGEMVRLAQFGLSLPDDLVALTQATHPDLCAAQTGGETQTPPLAERLAEIATDEERAALVRLGILS